MGRPRPIAGAGGGVSVKERFSMLYCGEGFCVIDNLLLCGGPFHAGGCGGRCLFVSNQTLLILEIGW